MSSRKMQNFQKQAEEWEVEEELDRKNCFEKMKEKIEKLKMERDEKREQWERTDDITEYYMTEYTSILTCSNKCDRHLKSQ